jgi:hypothetical protein
VTVVGWVAALVLAGIAALHFYWAAGGTTGASAAIPERGGRPAFSPAPQATALVALAFLAASAIVLARIGAWGPASGSPSWVRLGTWCIGGAFLLRAIGDFRLVGFFKRVRGTRFADLDSTIYSPLSLGVGVAVLWLAAQ